MNEAKHTPGPWRLEADPCHFDSLTTVTGGQRMNAHPNAWPAYPLTVQVGGMASVKEAQANARRIVACVNACEGFSIEELEGADLFKDSIESGNLINELLEALLVAHKHITEDRASYVRGVEMPDGSMEDEDAAILHEAYDSKLAQIEAAIAKATNQ